MREPLVSVAVITFNQLELLRECLATIEAQTYPNIEIVVADDASTDGTQDALREWARGCDRPVKLALAPVNRGITANCQSALERCDGEYIAWIGGDDLMAPRKIALQVRHMESNPAYMVSYHNLWLLQGETGAITGLYNSRRLNRPRTGGAEVSARYGTFNGGSSTMIRASCVPTSGFDLRIRHASDWMFWVECLASGGQITYLPDTLGWYRRYPTSITARSDAKASLSSDHLESCRTLAAKYPHLRSALRYREAWALRSLALSTDGRERVNLALRSLRMRPTVRALAPLMPRILLEGAVKAKGNLHERGRKLRPYRQLRGARSLSQALLVADRENGDDLSDQL